MVTTSQNRNGMVCNWFYTRCNNRMKIKTILKLQKVIEQRENPYDVLENIDTMSYFSKSKNTKIKIKDMHITHLLRVFTTLLERSNENKTIRKKDR